MNNAKTYKNYAVPPGEFLFGQILYNNPVTLPILPVETYIDYAKKVGVSGVQGEYHEFGVLPQHYADIFVGREYDDLVLYFDEVFKAGRTDCEYCMPYENNKPIFICRGIKGPIHEFWLKVKSFG